MCWSVGLTCSTACAAWHTPSGTKASRSYVGAGASNETPPSALRAAPPHHVCMLRNPPNGVEHNHEMTVGNWSAAWTNSRVAAAPHPADLAHCSRCQAGCALNELQAPATPAYEVPRDALGGRRRQRPQAAVVHRGGLQREPEAGRRGRRRGQKRAVLVRHHLAPDLWLLRAISSTRSQMMPQDTGLWV